MANPPAPDDMTVFDRRTLRRRRDRAAQATGDHGFLLREVAERLAGRLDDVRRGFPRALILGGHGGMVRRALEGHGGIGTVVECDMSPAMAAVSGAPLAVAADEEALPFAPASFDLIVATMSLHWVNDLPGALVQMRTILKPDGLLLAAMAGGETLFELRRALLDAEAGIEGGAGVRVSPFVALRDAGDLLQRAGFALPVADSDIITVTYADAFALMRDLRAMGESNAAWARRRTFSRRDTMFAAAARYGSLFGAEDGRIPASFQILTLTAWAPDAAQQKPLAPGSAAVRLADALGVDEKPAGEKAEN
jgi:SAM-dependent methyltransferase